MGKSKGMLIVDDDRAFLSVLEIYLNKWNYIIVGQAHSGSEALKILESIELKPSIVITDYIMPDGNGIFLTKKIAEKFTNIKVIIISGDNKMSKEKALQYGAIEFVRKEVNNFYTVLKEVLDSI